MVIQKRIDAIFQKSAEGDFEGYASSFYTLDRHGDIVLPGAYKDGLAEFLEDNFIGGKNHDHNNPLGKFYFAAEDKVGLYVKAQLSDIESARELRTLIRDGVIKKMSVGMRLQKISHVSPAKAKELQEKAGYQPDAEELELFDRLEAVRLIHKAQLFEVSPVTYPANKQAKIMAYKTGTPPNVERYTEKILQTARSIHDLSVKTGNEDARVESIAKTLRNALNEIETLVQSQPSRRAIKARQRVILARLNAIAGDKQP